MNNDILVNALAKLGVESKASGRNDIVVGDRKVSGSAYKVKLGKKDGTGKLSLHHGTMLLDVDLNALGRYLNPSKKKLESKGVDSVISRVMNLNEVSPEITYDSFVDSLEEAFTEKWAGMKVNKTVISEADLRKIDKIAELYESTNDWDWRFGQTPDFTNSIEHKFDWAHVDVMFNVEGGVIVEGKVFSDCLIPGFIDELNKELASGVIPYSTAGIDELCSKVSETLKGEDSMQTVVSDYIPQVNEWLKNQI